LRQQAPLGGASMGAPWRLARAAPDADPRDRRRDDGPANGVPPRALERRARPLVIAAKGLSDPGARSAITPWRDRHRGLPGAYARDHRSEGPRQSPAIG